MKKLLLIVLIFSFQTLLSQNKRRVDSLVAFSRATNSDTAKARTFCILCWEYRVGDTSKAKQFAAQGLQIAAQYEDDNIRAQCFSNLGDMCRDNAEYLRALGYYQKELELRRHLGDKVKIGNCLRDLGACYTKIGKYDQSIKHLLEALGDYEPASKNQKAVYNTNCAIAEVYYLDANYPQSIKYLEAALKISKETGDSLYISTAHMNLGLLYGENNEQERAMASLVESKTIAERLNLEETLETTYLNLGLLYSKKKDDKNALLHFEKCLEIAERLELKEDVAIVLSNMSQQYIRIGKYELAIQLGERSLALSKELDLKDKIKDAAANLAEANAELGNFQKAFTFQKLNSNMKDSLYTEDRQTTIAEMQTKYDVDKKEKENLLLNQKVELQELDGKQQKMFTYIALIALLFILSLAFFIYRGYRLKKKANVSLERQNNQILKQHSIIEEKNKDITDSITYAKRIQTAILPSEEEVQQNFTDSFVFYQPKAIVSGDFFWVHQSDASGGPYTFVAAVDCTGHGVPGGFMSMLGTSLLNEIVNEKRIIDPADILDMMRIKLITSLKQQGKSGENKDGMDMVLCRVNKERNELVYAAANNPLWLVREGECLEFAADKQPVGISTEHHKQFSQHSIPIRKGDCLYLFTDGYADQFGGPKGKKLKYKPFKEMLLSIHSLPMAKQHEKISTAFIDWKGPHEQVDDILIIGIRI